MFARSAESARRGFERQRPEPAAERLVHREQRRRGLCFALGKPVFGFEHRALRIEYGEEVRYAAVESCASEASRFRRCDCARFEVLLFDARFCVIGETRIGFFERPQHGLFIARERAVRRSFALTDALVGAAQIEGRPLDAGTESECFARRVAEVAKLSDIPGSWPVWSDFAVDRDDNLWVALPGDRGAQTTWQVFNREGVLLGNVPGVGSGVLDGYWTRDRIYVVAEDDEGLPIINVYRIVK